jgi:hypothetical protein
MNGTLSYLSNAIPYTKLKIPGVIERGKLHHLSDSSNPQNVQIGRYYINPKNSPFPAKLSSQKNWPIHSVKNSDFQGDVE